MSTYIELLNEQLNMIGELSARCKRLEDAILLVIEHAQMADEHRYALIEVMKQPVNPEKGR